MKVLFVCGNTLNPYVSTLVESLNKLDIFVDSSNVKFWTNFEDYDIYHFQWPEAVFDWRANISDDEVDALRNRLTSLKLRGRKIIVTCHNFKPHIITNKRVVLLYDLIYSFCDAFVHLGDYSRNILSEEYKNGIHVVVPHHIYDSIYKFSENQQRCKERLNLDVNKINILSFGEFRTDEERELIINLKDKLDSNVFSFIVPGFFKKRWISRSFRESFKRIKKILHYKSQGFKFTIGNLSDKETEEYFTACDIVLIQRKDILNSGNLPMGFYAGKVVVGANKGNVGQLLRVTGNPVFDPNNVESVVDSIYEAVDLMKKGKGMDNKLFAEENWAEDVVANRLLILYNSLF